MQDPDKRKRGAAVWFPLPLCCSSPNGVSRTLRNRISAAFILQDEPDRFSDGIAYKKNLPISDVYLNFFFQNDSRA